MSAAPSHPPPPWRLGGPCVVVPLLVPTARARAFVPSDVSVMAAAPGRTLGMLIVVDYEDPGSTLNYSELLVACATVRSGARVGGWISHIWVDDEQSVSGGRSIWKLPKELASFARAGDRSFAVEAGGTPLVRVAAARPRLKVPFAAPVPMISGGEGRHLFTVGRGTATAGLARVRVDVPEASPLAALDPEAGPVGITGRATLVMNAPTSENRGAQGRRERGLR